MAKTLIIITKLVALATALTTGEAGGEYIASVFFNLVSTRLGLWVAPQ